MSGGPRAEEAEATMGVEELRRALWRCDPPLWKCSYSHECCHGAFDGAAGPDALNGLWLKWCVRNYHGRWFRLGRALLAPSSYGSLAKSAGLLTR